MEEFSPSYGSSKEKQATTIQVNKIRIVSNILNVKKALNTFLILSRTRCDRIAHSKNNVSNVADAKSRVERELHIFDSIAIESIVTYLYSIFT